MIRSIDEMGRLLGDTKHPDYANIQRLAKFLDHDRNDRRMHSLADACELLDFERSRIIAALSAATGIETALDVVMAPGGYGTESEKSPIAPIACETCKYYDWPQGFCNHAKPRPPKLCQECNGRVSDDSTNGLCSLQCVVDHAKRIGREKTSPK